MILGVFTGLCELGGIQQLSRHIGAVLSGLGADRHEPCVLLSLNDSKGCRSFQVGRNTYDFQGFGRDKVSLTVFVLRRAAQVRFAFLGHVNLAPLGLLLRLANRSARYWVATHGVEVWERAAWIRRVALRRATGIVSVSHFTAERMTTAQRLHARKVSVFPVAVDPRFENLQSIAAPARLASDGPVILSVARLISSEPGKGIDQVIEAMPAVLRVVPDAMYVVVGDGDDRPRLEQLARDRNVSARVLFLGEVSPQDLQKYYAAAHVFALPSRQEGLGIVFLEAMAFAKPVITGNHGGTAELVREGVNGFLVEHGDVALLAEHLVRLLRDPQLARKMGEEGRRWVTQHHSFDCFRDALSAILNGTPAHSPTADEQLL